ncbi:hypothetical protein EMN47_19345 [Prolixibacteraceae bacterium JC049]|nr:hypothetical protein [Prolixibacteraceae bacterium JC049]
MKNSKKELVFLRAYALFTAIGFIAFISFAFNATQNRKFGTIDVERINVVEKNGDLKLVISNSEMQHNGMIDGKEFPKRQRPAGMIFFNSDGDECGGLIYDGLKEEAGLVLSIDQFKDDQIMQLQYSENPKNDKRKYGLQLWDFQKEDTFHPRMKRFEEISKMKTNKEKQAAYKQMYKDSLLSHERLFVGKKMNDDYGLFINDENGKLRIKIYIDKNNEPKMEFFDEKGKVVAMK